MIRKKGVFLIEDRNRKVHGKRILKYIRVRSGKPVVITDYNIYQKTE